MFFMYFHSYVVRHFHLRFITVLTWNPVVYIFVYVTDTPKLYKKYAETWVFVMFSGQWPPGKIYPVFILLGHHCFSKSILSILYGCIYIHKIYKN